MDEQDYREPLTHVEPVPIRVRFIAESTGGQWAVRQWRLAEVVPAEPGSGSETGLALELFVDEAQGYYLNLTSGEPSIMVKWRLPEDESGVVGDEGEPLPLAATLSYDEAGRWMDGGERVDRVPMPGEMAVWLAEFVQLHWKPEEKRKRGGTRPSFMNRDQFAQMVERERKGGSAGPGSAEPGSEGPGNAGQGR